jgi:PAS domain S-box-containing protein
MSEHAVESSVEIALDLNEKKSIRVLHVDDESSFLKVAKQCLEMQGPFQVDTASSAGEALEKLKKKTYDAVVSDYKMPGEDGLQFLEMLRKNGNNVPFIMFTGKGREEVAVKAWKLGADHYVNKTGDPETVYCELAHLLQVCVEKHDAEARVIETIRELETIYQNAVEGIGYVDREENIVFANKAFADIVGYEPEQLVGMNLRELVDDENWARVESETKRRQRGQSSRYEIDFRRRDGTSRNALVSAAPLFDRNGQFAGTVSIVLDTAERKKAEDALRNSEERYRLISSTTSDFVFSCIKKGKGEFVIDWIMGATERILGYSVEEIRKKGCWKFVVQEEDLPIFQKNVTGLKPGQSSKCELRITHKDGSTRWIKVSSRAILDNKDHANYRLFGAGEDITERKKAEHESFDKQMMLQSVFDASPALLIIDLNGKVVDCNKQAQNIFGYPSKIELVGRSALEPIAEQDLQRAKENMEKTLKQSLMKNVEYTIIAKDNSKHALSVSASVLRDASGKPVGFVSAMEDVTERKKAEEELRRFSTAVRTSLDGIITGDLNGNIADVNDAVLRMYGDSNKSDLIRKNVLDFVVESDRARALQDSMESMKTGQGKTIEYRALAKNGTEIPVEITTAFMRDEQGEPTGFVDIIRNISERKKAELALKESEARYRSLVEQSPAGIIIAQGPAVHGVLVNKAMTDIWGYTAEEFCSMSPQQIEKMIHSEYRTLFFNSFKARLERKNVPSRYEFQALRKDGNVIWLEISAGLIEYNGRAAVQGIFTDITERKKTELELQMSERKYRELADQLPLIIYEIDDKGRFTFVNETGFELTGYSRKDLERGLNILQMVAGEDRDKTKTRVQKALSGEKTGYNEYTVIKKDGTTFPALVCSSAIVREGKIVGLRGTVIDITERKKAEEEMQKSEERFRTLMEEAPIGICNTDLKGKITYVNKRFEEDTGYSREEIIGKNSFKFGIMSDETLKSLTKRLKGRLIEKPSHVSEGQFRRKDGEWIWAEVEGRLIKKFGVPVGFQLTIRDIAERKRAEKERKRYEEKLSALNTYSRDLNTAENRQEIYRLTLDAMQKVLGFEYADFMMIDNNMLYIADKRGYPEPFQLELPLDGSKKGITINVAKTSNSVIVEDVRKNRDFVKGLSGILSELAVPIKVGQKTLGVLNVESKELNGFNEKDQELLEILASHAATAISNLEYSKNLEAYAREILESQQRFERLFMDNPEAAVHLDASFHILNVNPRFMRLFGNSLDEIKGKQINDVIVPKDMMEEAVSFDERASKGEIYHEDTVRKRKDGSLVPVAFSAAPIIIDNHVMGHIAVYKDISQLKKAEEELKETLEKLAKTNEKLRVVGGLTRHDVRNKLSAITGNAYLAKKKLAGNSEVLNNLKEMELAVGQIVRIFDFAKTYEMIGIEELRRIDVENTIDEALSLFSDLKGVRVIDNCRGLTVLADSLLGQLFYNLVDNSLKYGEKIKTITVYYEEKNKDKLKLVYEDDGVGISESEKKKLFQEGYGRGTGYGLYSIRKICEGYGWNIEETGKKGEGAQFTITIPRIGEKKETNYSINWPESQLTLHKKETERAGSN